MLRRLAPYRTARVAVTALGALSRYRRLARRREAGRDPDPAEWQAAHERTARSLYDLAVGLEGLFIKLGQLIGARPDVVPEAYVEQLGPLHDRVPPRPFARLVPSVERALGAPLDRVFARVDPEPIAAASLAQVHRADLRGVGEVAVKIQYPEIAQLVRVDLASLQRVAHRTARRFPQVDPQPLVDELAHFLALELDFEREAESSERVRAALAGDEGVRVPRIHREVSSRTLLVMEFLDGVPLTDLPRLRATGVDLRDLGERIASLYARMIFEQGFFHGDPHPGNLLVLPGGVIGLVDFGLAKELPLDFGRSLAALVTRTMARDTPGAIDAARRLGFNVDELDQTALHQLVDQSLGRVRAAEPTAGGRRRRHRDPERRRALEALTASGTPVRIPHHFALVGRTVMLLSGLGHSLAPGEGLVQRTLRTALIRQVAADAE